jgi:hypothetical protein
MHRTCAGHAGQGPLRETLLRSETGNECAEFLTSKEAGNAEVQ